MIRLVLLFILTMSLPLFGFVACGEKKDRAKIDRGRGGDSDARLKQDGSDSGDDDNREGDDVPSAEELSEDNGDDNDTGSSVKSDVISKRMNDFISTGDLVVLADEDLDGDFELKGLYQRTRTFPSGSTTNLHTLSLWNLKPTGDSNQLSFEKVGAQSYLYTEWKKSKFDDFTTQIAIPLLINISDNGFEFADENAKVIEIRHTKTENKITLSNYSDSLNGSINPWNLIGNNGDEFFDITTNSVSDDLPGILRTSDSSQEVAVTLTTKKVMADDDSFQMEVTMEISDFSLTTVLDYKRVSDEN